MNVQKRPLEVFAPVKMGIQGFSDVSLVDTIPLWIPASAGMTEQAGFLQLELSQG